MTYVPVLGKRNVKPAHEKEREMGRGAGKEGTQANEKENAGDVKTKKEKSQSLSCVRQVRVGLSHKS